jgi:predicted methyltransferase
VKRGAIGLALLLAACTSAPPPAGRPEPHRRPAQVMGYQGAPWLERSGRDLEERPDLVLEAMQLENGDVVADIGCGTGYFARRVAAAVAPEGRVYCVDVQPEMLQMAERLAEQAGISNIVPVLATETNPRLPPGEIDWALLVDVYHELQQPQAVLHGLRAALAPEGRVALVEYRLDGVTARHIKLEHRMSPGQVLGEWEPAGFRLVELIETLPSQHLFVLAADPME